MGTSGNPATGGTVLGYDIETWGDTLHGNKGAFGITEIGIGKTVFESNTGLYKQDGHSLAIGLSKDDANFIYNIVDKYKTNGWNDLTNAEQVTMKRMSMYAGNDTNFKNVFMQITEEGSFKNMWSVKQLSEASMSIEKIERGIENLRKVYDFGATSESVLPKAMQYLDNMHQNGSILTAANSMFDTTTLSRYTNGEYTDIINSLKKDTVDLVYGARTAADVRLISVSKYQDIYHGNRGGGASVQSLLHSLGLNQTETHLAISDINQQIQILASRNYANGKTLGGDLQQFFEQVTNPSTGTTKNFVTTYNNTTLTKTYKADDTLFLK